MTYIFLRLTSGQMRAKAVFLRDLEQLRAKKQASQQPPAPMVIDLNGLKPAGPAVPVAPMMATGGSPFIANRGIPKTEGKPVAPFPDMGMGIGAPNPKPAGPVPFSRAKPPIEQKRPSPKQPTPKQTPKPAPKSNPPSGRMGNKPNPMANAQRQAPKPPATAPPSAPAVAPAPVPAAPPAPPAPMPAPPPAPVAPVAPVALVTAAQPPPAPMPNASAPPSNFTSATFTVDPTNNDSLMQPGGGDINMDMQMFDMDNFGAGGPTDPANINNNPGHDTTMSDDLDHFFDLSGDSGANLDSNFNSMDDYMNSDFTNFDDFQ